MTQGVELLIRPAGPKDRVRDATSSAPLAGNETASIDGAAQQDQAGATTRRRHRAGAAVARADSAPAVRDAPWCRK